MQSHGNTPSETESKRTTVPKAEGGVRVSPGLRQHQRYGTQTAKQQHKEMASVRTPAWTLVANGYFVEDTLIGTGNCLYYRSVKPGQDRTGQVSEQGRLT